MLVSQARVEMVCACNLMISNIRATGRIFTGKMNQNLCVLMHKGRSKEGAAKEV